MKQNKNPGRRAKADLPEKICLICQRPFRWRKSGKPFGTMLNIAVINAE